MCSLFEDRGEYVDSKLHLISKKFIQEVKGAERVTRKKKKKKKENLKEKTLNFTLQEVHWFGQCRLCFFILSTGLLPDLSTLLHFWWLSVQPPSPLSWTGSRPFSLVPHLPIVAFLYNRSYWKLCHIHAWASLMISYFPRMKTNSVSTS